MSKNGSRTGMNTMQKMKAIIELLILLGIIIGIPLTIYIINPQFFDNFKSVENFDAWISEYTHIGVIVYIFCQMVQIIISVIPGQAIQIAGGFIFGFFVTFIISLIGAFLGTFIAFHLAKFLGRDAVRMICGEERFNKYQALMKTKRARKIIFFLYLIPGFPKDVVTYAAGVSGINGLGFVFISLMGRTPAMTLSILFGVLLYSDSYVSAVILAAVVLILFGLCIIKRKSLTEFIEKDRSERGKIKKTGSADGVTSEYGNYEASGNFEADSGAANENRNCEEIEEKEAGEN